MAFYLAIDNGGTKTDYVLADDTQILARVRTGTIKRMRTDAATASANLESALQELSSKTGITMQSITRTCVGTAGDTVPLVTDWLREAFAARVSGDLLLLGDVEIALDAAFQGGAGVLVLAGTGSNVVGRTPQGELVGAGGWGPALADQGSGHRIGLQALRAIFLAIDEGRKTALHNAVLKLWNLRDTADLVAYANQIPSPDYSRLTPLIYACADRGDVIASEVLRDAGEELGYVVRLVLRKLAAASADEAASMIAFAGSIMENVKPVREALVQDVRREFPNLRALEGVVDPILGALWRARRGS